MARRIIENKGMRAGQESPVKGHNCASGHRPVLRDVQKVLNETQMPLMLNEEHKFVFREKPPTIRRRESCILKDYL